jgi:deoxyribonuclease-4
MYLGAHIPREKNLMETMKMIMDNDGNSLQIFASNPRSIHITEYNHKFFGNPDEIKSFISKTNFKLVIHSPYTINLASSMMINKRTMTLDECYWIKILLKELEIADRIGAIGCVVHTGKSVKLDVKDGLRNMRICIEFIIGEIIKNGWSSKLILETASGQGTELLSNYQDFLNFYNDFNENQKEVFKICIDTCHIWAMGYELKEVVEMTIKNGNMKDVIVVHINNSKNPKGSRLDRHLNINQGFINIDDIYRFIKNFRKSVIILETPIPEFSLELYEIKKHI